MTGLARQAGRARRRAVHLTARLPLTLDRLIGVFLFGLGLYAYTAALAPTVLEGDNALFQYTPHVLGVTYPTGFPLYILLGKGWLTLVPWGEIAWRMNFLSAFCSALTLPLLYATSRRLFEYDRLTAGLLPAAAVPADRPAGQRPDRAGGSDQDRPLGQAQDRGPAGQRPDQVPSGPARGSGSRWAALAACLTFATLPTFWLWSTGAKTYALTILLFSTTLYLLSRSLSPPSSPSPAPSAASPTRSPLRLPALLTGLQISVHNTAVLLLPGLLLLVWLHFRPYLRGLKSWLLHGALLTLPGLFYLYIPLRAEWLIARYGRLEAIERGLVADFYHSGWTGLLRYFTAADFTGGVVANWGLVPGQFFTRYLPLLTDNFTGLGVALGLVGGLTLAFLKPRLFWSLFLIYAAPIPFVLAYGQGEQAAFLLPSFLIFALFTGHAISFVERLTQFILAKMNRPADYAPRLTSSALRFLPFFLFCLLTTFLFLPQIRSNINWLDVKWSRPIEEAWTDNLNHPLEPEATILARWGDLTSFWYMQYAEERRPDLRGLYPPTEETVADWFDRGGENLYIAGPLESWAPGVERRYQLLPWGRLVRIAPRSVEPETLLPDLPHPGRAVFDDKLRLIGFDYAPQATHGSDYPVTLTWQTLAELPPETTVSLRLSQGQAIATQLDDALLSGWFPRETLPAGQHVLNYSLLPIPVGTLPGVYDLQLVVYTSYKHPWPHQAGATLLDLGEVEVTLPPPGYRPDPAALHTVPDRHDFNGEIKLAGYEYSASRVGQGKGFAVRLLWQALAPPVDNYTLLAEVVDSAGTVIRAVEHRPAGGQAPTGTWQAGQFVRDQVDLVLPAGTPPGQETIAVRLSWLRPDGSRLAVRRWFIPFGYSLTLERLAVTEKKGRVFTAPVMAYAIDGANFENKARLVGYNGSTLQQTTAEEQAPLSEPTFQLSRADCQAAPETCRLTFDFYWQGIGEMENLYYVFLHVLDEQGHIVAQHDRSPGKRGKQPTTAWLPGEVVADPIDLALPPDLAPGQYTLRLGLYLHPTGPRLHILDDAGQPVANFIDVGTLQLLP